MCNVKCRAIVFSEHRRFWVREGVREQKRKEEMTVSVHFYTRNTVLALSTKKCAALLQSLTSQYFHHL